MKAKRLLKKLNYLPRWAWYLLSLSIGGPFGPLVVYLIFHALDKAAKDEEEENGFEYIKAVAAKTGVLVPEGLKDLEHKEIRHTGVVTVDKMEDAVREALSK